MTREYFKERFFPPGMVRDDQVYYWYISDGVWTVVEDAKLEEYRVPGKIYTLQAVTRGNYELLYFRDEFECDTEEEIITPKFKEKELDRRVFSSGLQAFLKIPDEYLKHPKYEDHLYSMLDLHELYYTKNKDYGDAFTQSLDKYGPIAALVRMEDKWNRLSNLMYTGKEGYIKSESVEDTLIDLANYAIMTSLYLRGKETD